MLDVNDDFDVHIQSFASRCNICSLNYDFIGKMETFDQDLRHIIQEAHLEGRISQKIHLRRSSGGSTEDLALKYFSTVSRIKIQRLYDKYKHDFQMFDYSPQAFIDAGLE